MEGYDKKETIDREEIFSKVVRAGKRTYFFDVKSTRKDDYYLTITESKKRFDKDGNFHFEKHKVFLYKEDFDKFSEGLLDAIGFIKENQPYTPEVREEETTETNIENSYVDVEFEDLAN